MREEKIASRLLHSVKTLGVPLLLAALLASCAQPKGPITKKPVEENRKAVEVKFAPVTYGDLKGWERDTHADALVSLAKNCTAVLAGEAEWLPALMETKSAEEAWRGICQMMREVPRGGEKTFIETAFQPFQVTSSQSDGAKGKLTAYYTPSVAGSWTRLTPYATPLFSMPPDLVPGDPKYTRRAIAEGAIAASKALIWVNDPVDAFYMQIQGAGEIVMADGSKVLLEVDGINGHPWKSPGKQGLNRAVLKSLFKHDPAAAVGLMNGFPRYVFYRVAPTDQVRGAAKLPLTDQRSIAVDNRYIPLGTPVWVDAQSEFSSVQKLTVAQDVGGAIKGTVRADLYMGRGENKGDMARKINHDLKLYALFPRSQAELAKLLSRPKPIESKPVQAMTPKVVETPVKKEMGKGAYAIQLGAFGNPQSAQKRWKAIKARASTLLNGIDYRLSAYKTFHRLRAGPLATRSQASGLCGKLKALGVDCFPVKGMN